MRRSTPPTTLPTCFAASSGFWTVSAGLSVASALDMLTKVLRSMGKGLAWFVDGRLPLLVKYVDKALRSALDQTRLAVGRSGSKRCRAICWFQGRSNAHCANPSGCGSVTLLCFAAWGKGAETHKGLTHQVSRTGDSQWASGRRAASEATGSWLGWFCCCFIRLVVFVCRKPGRVGDVGEEKCFCPSSVLDLVGCSQPDEIRDMYHQCIYPTNQC